MALLLLMFSLGLVPTGALSETGNHIRWISGTSPYTYLVGGPDQGALDLARNGNSLLVPDVYWGISCWEIVGPGQVEERGHLDALARRVATEGDFAYVAEAEQLLVAEITSSGDLLPRGSLGGFSITDLAVQGDYVYTADWTGVRTISVADPDTPTLVGSLAGDCVRIAVDGNRAYVSRLTGLWIVDITNPTAPAFLGETFSAQNLYDIVIDGDVMYVAQTSYGMRIFDLTDPDAPALIGGVPFIGGAALTVGEGHALIGGQDAFLHVDVSHPASPAGGGTSRSAGIFGGEVVGGHAYLGSFHHGLQVMDLGDGTSPVPVATLPGAAFGHHLTPIGSELALLDDQGLQILDVSDPESPSVLGSLTLPFPESMCAQGGYLYVVANGLYVVDASDRSAPSIVGYLADLGGQLAVTANDRVYVSAVTELYVIDVTVPSQPLLLYTDRDFFLGIGALAIDGYDVYVGANYESAGFVDKFDYTIPQSRATVAGAVTGWVSDLVVRDGTLYCAGPFEVSAWDTNLAFLSAVGEHEFAGGLVQNLIAAGSAQRLLTSNPWGGFHLFEDLGGLAYLGSGATPNVGAYGIADLGTHLYITDSTGLHVYETPCGTTGVGGEGPPRGDRLQLLELRTEPNPSSGSVHLVWGGSRLGSSGGASSPPLAPDHGVISALELFDSQGRRIRTLRPTDRMDSITWDGRNDAGFAVPSGVYWARLRTTRGQTERSFRVIR